MKVIGDGGATSVALGQFKVGNVATISMTAAAGSAAAAKFTAVQEAQIFSAIKVVNTALAAMQVCGVSE